jgi:ABC-2 type transport system permease protein
MLLQYRAAALAGCATQLFWGIIRMMIFAGFYAASTAAQPMTYAEVVNYIWLGQATILLTIIGSDAEVRDMIRSGAVVYEMARPVDLYRLWYCRALAGRVAPLLLRMLPIFLVAVLCFGLSLPASPIAGLLWVLATAGAILLAASFSTLITITHLWTIAGDGVNRILPMFLYVFSGMIVPLPFFPDSIQPLLRFLPFRGVGDTPFRIYIGHIPPNEAILAVLHQLAWTTAIMLFGNWLLRRGIRRLVVQGG